MRVYPEFCIELLEDMKTLDGPLESDDPIEISIVEVGKLQRRHALTFSPIIEAIVEPHLDF